MKKLGLSVGIVLGVLFLAPTFIGDFVESKFNETVNNLASHPSIEVVDSKFEKQWFTGSSTLTIRTKGDLDEFQAFDITVIDNIYFGPVIFSDEGVGFNLSQSQSQLSFNELLVDDEVVKLINDNLSMRSQITYGLDYESSFILNEISTEEDGNTMTFGEMKGEFTLSNDQTIQGIFNWEGIQFNGPTATFMTEGAYARFDQTLISGNIYDGSAISVGDIEVTIPALSLTYTETLESFTLKQLSIKAKSSLENNLLNIKLNYHVDELSAAEQVFKHFNFDFDVQKLDATLLAKLNHLSTQLSNTNPQQPSQIPEQEILDVFNGLLLQNPEVTIADLSVETPDGVIQSSANIQVTDAQINLSNPMAAIKAVKASAEGHAPILFFENVGMKPVLDIYIEQGFLQKAGDEVIYKLSFSHGKLTVNDMVLPLF